MERVGDYAVKQQEDKSELKKLVNTLNPGGPKYNYFGFLKFGNGQLYTCNGNVGGNKTACIQILAMISGIYTKMKIYPMLLVLATKI